MTEEKLWLLVSLQLSGEATPAELEELQLLVQEDSQIAERVIVLQDMWKARYDAVSPTKDAMSFDKHLQRLSNFLGMPVLQFDEEQIENNAGIAVQRKSFHKWVWIGSCAAASLIIAFLLLMRPGAKINELALKSAGNTISTKPGSKSKIELPDGTQVWLNADSKLEYSGDFSGKLREVTLSGEAYFDVVKDKSRPFIIHTSTAQIKVLGTAFNVRSYPGDNTTETALIRGSVEVILNGKPDKKVVLKPNEKVIIDNARHTTDVDAPDQQADNAGSMVVKNVHIDKKDQEVYETMWVKNKLAFDETPFDNMIAEVERWYNVDIIVKNKRLSTGVYTFTFENKTLDEVLEGLQFSAHFQYQRKDGIVTIW